MISDRRMQAVRHK